MPYDATPDAPAPLPLQQSPLYHTALTRIGADVVRHDLPCGAALVVRRRLPGLGRVALVSRAALGDGSVGRGLRHALGARVLIVNAETPGCAAGLHRAGFLRLATPQSIARLSLAGSGDDWLSRMEGKWRNRLRHAQRGGLDLAQAPLPPDPQHWLLHKDAAQQAARGYRNLPPALIVAMAKTPGALCLITARHGGRCVAAMLFAHHGSTASYLIGWSHAQGRKLSAHNLSLWQAMGDLAGRGARWIDLGLCDRRAAPGLARFKLGSGAVARDLGGTWADVGPLAPLHAGLRATRPWRATNAPAPAAPPGFPAR
jgi:hypothetical protein